MRRPLRVSVVVASGLAAAASAEARGDQPASVSVSVDYGAPQGCPRSDAFAGELAARTPRAHVVTPSPGVRAIVVRIKAHKGTYVGRVVLRETDGTETERTVTGTACGEVVTGLALIAALAIDPSAGGGANTGAGAGGGASAS
jgi:hypothetical protein